MDELQHFHQSSRKFARAQRRNMTRAETMLWRALRNHRLDGHGFAGKRRSAPTLPISFVWPGGAHDSADARARDAERDAWLRGARAIAF